MERAIHDGVTLTSTSRSLEDDPTADCCAFAHDAGVTGAPRLAERGVPEPPAALAIGDRKPHMPAPCLRNNAPKRFKIRNVSKHAFT